MGIHSKCSWEAATANLIFHRISTTLRRAENKIYGYVRNLKEAKTRNKNMRIIVTGCLVETAAEIRFIDEVPHEVKVQRFHFLDDMINQAHKDIHVRVG